MLDLNPWQSLILCRPLEGFGIDVSQVKAGGLSHNTWSHKRDLSHFGVCELLLLLDLQVELEVMRLARPNEMQMRQRHHHCNHEAMQSHAHRQIASSPRQDIHYQYHMAYQLIHMTSDVRSLPHNIAWEAACHEPFGSAMTIHTVYPTKLRHLASSLEVAAAQYIPLISLIKLVSRHTTPDCKLCHDQLSVFPAAETATSCHSPEKSHNASFLAHNTRMRQQAPTGRSHVILF